MNPVLTAMFQHNLWANLRLIDSCAAQPDAVLETHVSGTYGTIRDTLGHLVGCEEGYLAFLVETDAAQFKANPKRAALREQALQSGEVLSVATIREHAAESGRGLTAYAAEVAGDPKVTVTVVDQTYEMPVSLLLVLAISHATEHRSQVLTALT